MLLILRSSYSVNIVSYFYNLKHNEHKWEENAGMTYIQKIVDF